MAPPPCPLVPLLALLAGPWTLLILWVLGSHGPVRFGALRRKVAGISPRVLTARLRLLEAHGFVRREYKATVPPEITYALTPRTQELMGVFDSLHALARKWRHEDEQTQANRVQQGQGADSRTSSPA